MLDREENLLRLAAEALPPPEDVIRNVTPWRRSLRLTLAGLALQSITLQFLLLQYLLPLLGALLVLLGLRSLRRSCRPFGAMYALAWLRVLTLLPVLVLNATIWAQRVYASVGWALSGANVLLTFLQLICLWLGLRRVQRAAGLPPRAPGAAGMLFWFAAVCLAALFSLAWWPLMLALILAYVLLLRSLWKLSGALDEAGYALEAAPVRLPDWGLTTLLLGLLALGLALAYAFFGSYPMRWQLREETRLAEAAAVSEELEALGFPAAVLADLTDADILACAGAQEVVVTVRDFPVNDGRQVLTTDEYGVQIYDTVYDTRELRLTNVAVLLNTERETWRIFHHFLWTVNPGFCGTESIQLWPAWYMNEGWAQGSAVTGRLLCERGGATYTAPYFSLGLETYESTSLFFGTQTRTDFFACFSLPADGQAVRGYLTYAAEETQDGYIMDAWINYTHQAGRLQYPVLSARDSRQRGGWSMDGVFRTIQDAIQFYPNADVIEPY